jgi:hypothetical protein
VLTVEPLPHLVPDREVCSINSKDVLTLYELLCSDHFLIGYRADCPKLFHCEESKFHWSSTELRVAAEVSQAEMVDLLRKGLLISPYICTHLATLHEFWEGDQKSGRRDRERFVKTNIGAVLDVISSNLYFASRLHNDMLLSLRDDIDLLTYDSN